MRHFAILLLLLIGCDSKPIDEVSVRRVYVADEAELKAKCGDDLVVEPLGCARGGRMTTPVTVCFIYAMKPRGYDDHRRVETLGHELMHCFDGPKHT